MVLALAAHSLKRLTVVSGAGPALYCTFLALGRQVWLQTTGTALVPEQLRHKVFGLFEFWITLIDLQMGLMGCVEDMRKSKSILSLVWDVFFSLALQNFFFLYVLGRM